MPGEINIIPNVSVEYTGIMNFLEIYIKSKDLIEGVGYKWSETEYSEKLTTEGGKDIVIKWDCKKDIDLYAQLYMKVKFQTFNLVDVDVVVNGKKIRMQRGTIRVFIDGGVMTDRSGKWEDNPTLHFFQHFYERYIYKSQLDLNIKNITVEGGQFHTALKDWFEGYRQMHLLAQ